MLNKETEARAICQRKMSGFLMVNYYYIKIFVHFNEWQSYPTKNRELKPVKDKFMTFKASSQNGNILKMNFLQEH